MNRPANRTLWSKAARVLGLFALVLLPMLAGPGESHAELDPYYVLRGLGSGDVRPRVLFVVDTSGSMSWRAQAADEQCEWRECESQTDARESRISAARRVINDVISRTSESASFSLMTFDQYDPPTATPARCANNRRFAWVTYYGYFVWDLIDAFDGVTGSWRLCQGDQQRPYAYLRWDELGHDSPIDADDQVGPVPPSPLIGATPDHADNADRKVQWFPRFMGIRAQLNDETDPGRSILYATYGDYGSDDASRLSNVWGRDFYYWPYVDGFPLYSGYSVWPYDNGLNAGGVIGQSDALNAAKLYAPFYLDLSESTIPAADWGPASLEEAQASVLSKTAPLIEGGVDAGGGTPWASVVGLVDQDYPRENTEGSHASIASYLKFVNAHSGGGACAPTSAVLITDGVPSPSSEGGATLYQRLADLRNDLGVKTYVVGFFQSTGEINNMACAAAGACDGGSCASPCNDAAANDFDTCADPDDPDAACAYLAGSSDELATVLTSIVTAALDVELPSGPGSTTNEFGVGAAGAPGEGGTLQTSLAASTAWPGWRGSVRRELCTHRDEDGELLEQCTLPSPEWDADAIEHVFGPCPQSHAWDAGACLQQTLWSDRRVFTTTVSGEVIAVSDEDGRASPAFRNELQVRGLINGVNLDDKADAFVAFVLGRDWPDDWKLPGLATSTPTLIRRVPRLRSQAIPSVAIRDPHCGGRRLSDADASALPPSLEDFAKSAWSTTLPDGGPHFEYQEAVLVGDDLGMLHAFQYNSGNELWGFIPGTLLESVAAQVQLGAAAMGQPEALDEHIYGISSSVNDSWVYDDSSADAKDHRWRHLAVFGFGPGGSDYVALDVSHMSPASDRGPIEVLWTTDDPGLAATYDDLLGQTWSRPSLTYHVPSDDMSNEPDPFLVVGSGYGDGEAGRHLLRIDALTGNLLESVDVGVPAADTFSDAFGLVSDAAVGTHCLSRFWAEAQETYVTDPSGRLFRWDLGRTADHDADSEEVWSGTARPVAQFRACVGVADACTVSASNPGEPFSFAPAVTANDRIDDQANAAGGLAPEGEDQFLIALASGAHNDSGVTGHEGTNEFHASLYLLVDDHRAQSHQGFDIPPGAPKMSIGQLGTYPGYMRLALSDIERTRTFVPYPGADEFVETRAFSANTRPIRAPRIVIRGVVDDAGETPQVIDGVEVVEVTYFVHEPPTATCDPRFFDPKTETWHYDQGATFQVRLQLTVDTASGFNFSSGAGEDVVDFDGSGVQRGLTMLGAEQERGGDCEDGNCGPQPTATPNRACDNNVGADQPTRPTYVMPLSARQLSGFTPVEG